MEGMKARPDVLVRINMIVEKVAHGTDAEVLAEAERVYRLAGSRDPVLIGTGVLPYETPPERVRMIGEYLESL
jgi:hypothetical protein